jgi:hypothetical protein
MKKIKPTFYLSFLLLSACTHPYLRGTFPSGNTITKYPIPPPHNRDVKVFFPREIIKDTDYVKITVIEIYDSPQTSYNELVNKLKKDAQNYGVDAVIILDKNEKNFYKYRSGYSNPFNGSTYYQSGYRTLYFYPALSALGFVYRKHLDYIKLYPKSVKISVYESDTTKNSASFTFPLDNDRNVRDTFKLFPYQQMFYFTNFIKKYDPFYLIQQDKGWMNYKNGSNKIYKRVYTLSDKSKYVCRFKYNNELIESITSHSVSYRAKILLSYNNEHAITEAIIFKESEKYKEFFFYDNMGRLVRTKYFKIIHNTSIPFIEAEYDYPVKEEIFNE